MRETIFIPKNELQDLINWALKLGWYVAHDQGNEVLICPNGAVINVEDEDGNADSRAD